ncbi:MAG TPA: cytochrome c oxidase assembly protein [Anaerolineae bacterium]
MLLQIAVPTYGWIFEPSIIVGFLCLAVLYGYLIYLARKDGYWGKAVNRNHVIYFSLGLLTLIIALLSPLDSLSDEALFSAHMVQHMLLMLIAPALSVAGLPHRWLKAIYDLPIVGRLASIVAHPLVALLIFNLTLWLWHIPTLYEGALRDDTIHVIEHLTFMAAGTLMWLPVLRAVPPKSKMGYLAKIGYLFVSMISTSILSAIFTFANNVIFPFYGNLPLTFGLTPLADQQLAGGIMWVPGSGIFMLAMSITFFAWLRNEERKGEAKYPPPPQLTPQ